MKVDIKNIYQFRAYLQVQRMAYLLTALKYIQSLTIKQILTTKTDSNDLKIEYTINPSEYKSSSAAVILYKDGELIDYISSETQTSGSATLTKGFQFDINSKYEVEVVLNYRTGVEMRSERKSLVLSQCTGIASVEELDQCPNRVQNPDWQADYDGCTNIFDNPAAGYFTAFSNDEHTGACDEHDRCYQTCWPGNESEREDARLACDKKFRDIASLNCWDELIVSPVNAAACLIYAEAYYMVLMSVGDPFFEERQKQVCNCCK